MKKTKELFMEMRLKYGYDVFNDGIRNERES